MSAQLLQLLDNRRSPKYSELLSRLCPQPRIAWYPSAGTDFRPLYFLSDHYLSNNPPVNGVDSREPDIYLYTDYRIYNELFEKILFRGENPIIHDDGRSKVVLSDIEYLGRIHFASYPDYTLTEENAHFFNRVFFFYVTIESAQFGLITKPVLYAFSCNEQFCSELMIPSGGKISQVIHVRYGHGFGGANCSGHWIQHVLSLLGCEMYVHDGLSHYSYNEHNIIEHYGNVIPQKSLLVFKTIREIDGLNRSHSTRIIWQEVQNKPDVLLQYKPNPLMRPHSLDSMFR